MAATMSGLNAADYGRKSGIRWTDRRLTPTRRADGPSACPCDSSHGPGGVGISDNSRSVMQQADKSIRVRNAGEDLRPRLRFSSTIFGVGLDHRPCADGMRDARIQNSAGAAGAVKRPVVPHAPWGDEEQDDRRALEPDKTWGDDARPWPG